MQKSTDKDAIVARINGDILTIINLADDIGWKPIHEQSISRILYLASVLYAFRHTEGQNPFSDDYHFSIDATGPFYYLINNSLAYLESNDFIIRENKNKITIGDNKLKELNILPDYDSKKIWLGILFYILGIYGESRIYEFIIRDPEYIEHLQTNKLKELNTNRYNKTVTFLNEFKKTFEETLGQKANQIDDKEYLELYFEYVFGKVLKGEIEL